MGDEQSIRVALGDIVVPPARIEAVHAKDALVQVTLSVPRSEARAMEPMRAAAEAALARLPGVLSATVVLTAHSEPAAPARKAAAGKGAMLLPEVSKIVAIASGKGGVGKSTTAVNLAVALVEQGLRVGLLDADIFGPSLPQMLGTQEKPRVTGNRIHPIQRWGLKAMSIGFLVEQETAMIWRGPMVMGALEQMMGQVEWGALDILVVDMPPGTGDAQLTMSQRVPLAGAVIVSTPQDVALIDARRGVRMFEKVGVPVLGLIENMSYYCCPKCGERAEIFGHGGAQAEAARLGCEFLGALPLKLAIRELADAGTPIVAARPESEEAAQYRAIAARVWAKLQVEAAPAGPSISFQ